MTRALVAVVLFCQGAQAQDARGFAEVRVAWFPGASGAPVQVVERVRPTFQVALLERVKLVATVEAALAEGRDTGAELARLLTNSDLAPLLEAAQCEPVSRANSLLRIDGARDYLDVDRLFLDVYGTWFDLRVGRQALNWGSARFINPTDPFPQVLLAEPWRPRRGVNAVRLTIPIGKLADATGVLAANDAFTAARVTGRVRANWKGVDLALVGAYRGDSNSGFVGIDVRGTLGVGYWLEGAWVFSSTPHEELSAGVDYSFPLLEQFVVFVQYSRNGGGALSPDGYAATSSRLGQSTALKCASANPFRGTTGQADPFASFTAARDYLLVGASLGILPGLSASLSALQNLDDGTGLVLPTVSWTALDWLDVAASASIPIFAWGRGGEFKPRPEDLQLTVTTPVGTTLSANLAGLVPAVTLTVWTRASF